MPVESRMNRNVHVRFGGAGRGNGPSVRAALRPGSTLPYTARVCLNGHHFAQRQAAKAGIGFQSLDNGFVSTDDPEALALICRSLTPARIEAFVRKWLRILPHPYTVEDRAAGYHYDISILQAEFSLTQVLDRPLAGRVFFEEVIRENLDRVWRFF